jgi:muconate cycloisomerase
MDKPPEATAREIKTGPLINSISLTPVFVPFHSHVREIMESSGGLGMAIPAEEPWPGVDAVICELKAEDGSSGLGEALVWLPETGVSNAQVIDAVKCCLGKYVVAQSPFNVELIRRRMDINIARTEVAKGLLDMACYDLMGRITGRSACDFMGGRTVERIPLAALIPLMDPEKMIEVAVFFHDEGYKSFRLKLGRSIADDVKTMDLMRKTFGAAVKIRVDYNQAYSRAATAIMAIKAIEPYGLDYAEQPVRNGDYLGMAAVQKRVDTPLMSHEDCFSLQDIATLIELKAIGVVGLNPERPGGVTAALRALDYAEMRGLGAVLHSQPLGIASAMLIHLAAARHHQLGHATELFGQVMIEDDLITEPIDYSGGSAGIPAGPGWGVTLDRDALDKYATGPATVIS